MKNHVFALLAFCLTIVACNQNNKTSAIDKRLCGRWMTVSNMHSNEERYWLKKDGTFTDAFYASMSAISTKIKLPQPKSWHVTGNQLFLQYNLDRYVFLLFKVPAQFTMAYTIEDITDSSMILGTRATKHYAANTITLKRMKLNGKYIEQ